MDVFVYRRKDGENWGRPQAYCLLGKDLDALDAFAAHTLGRFGDETGLLLNTNNLGTLTGRCAREYRWTSVGWLPVDAPEPTTIFGYPVVVKVGKAEIPLPFKQPDARHFVRNLPGEIDFDALNKTIWDLQMKGYA